MRQFLLEAVILSVGGGLLGIVLGVGASTMIAHLVRWSTELSWVAILVSFTISAAIGIVFGYYPAQQASRVTPMTLCGMSELVPCPRHLCAKSSIY